MTGMLDRLEAAGWMPEADPADRRAVLVHVFPMRGRDVFKLYSGMNSAIDQIAGSYSPSQLG